MRQTPKRNAKDSRSAHSNLYKCINIPSPMGAPHCQGRDDREEIADRQVGGSRLHERALVGVCFCGSKGCAVDPRRRDQYAEAKGAQPNIPVAG
jgi:hypothetical protein